MPGVASAHQGRAEWRGVGKEDDHATVIRSDCFSPPRPACSDSTARRASPLPLWVIGTTYR
jgi:hypothetical protein